MEADGRPGGGREGTSSCSELIGQLCESLRWPLQETSRTLVSCRFVCVSQQANLVWDDRLLRHPPRQQPFLARAAARVAPLGCGWRAGAAFSSSSSSQARPPPAVRPRRIGAKISRARARAHCVPYRRCKQRTCRHFFRTSQLPTSLFSTENDLPYY